jgi:PD-(D/E)XK nuclease superfamily
VSQIFKLSPSDFAFLWEECKRCFYLKVVSGFQRPRPIMPKIFNNIDSQMKQFFAGKRTRDVLTALPEGIVQFGDKWVESVPLSVGSHKSQFFVRGKLDTVLRLDDGAYAVIDFKTSERKSEHIPLYARQLNAYAISLENAPNGRLRLKPVTHLGLVVYEPESFRGQPKGSASLEGSVTWIEIPRDDAALYRFMDEMLGVLELAAPPGGAPGCEWCIYRDASRRTGL